MIGKSLVCSLKFLPVVNKTIKSRSCNVVGGAGDLRSDHPLDSTMWVVCMMSKVKS